MSGADAVLPDGERSEPDEDGQGRASVTRAAWRLLGAALISQIGISVVEQGIPVLTGFIKTDHRCVCRGGGADRLRVHGRTGTRLVRSRCRRRPALAGVALIGFQGLWVTMISEAAGPDRAGAATGFGITFVAFAIAASPPLYGLVADLAGSYRAIWAALALVLAVAFIPALLVPRAQPHRHT